MHYTLAESVWMAFDADHAILLDARNDRYLCAGGMTFETLQAVARGEALTTAMIASVATLIENRCLSRAERPPAPVRPITGRCVAQRRRQPSTPTPSVLRLSVAWLRLAAARASLSIFPLHRVLSRLGASKPAVWCDEHSSRRLVDRAEREFRSLRLLASTHRRCLSTSLALAQLLVRQGVDARLVVGVKLHPFAAHAWVEWSGYILNDDDEVTRRFTPIATI